MNLEFVRQLCLCPSSSGTTRGTPRFTLLALGSGRIPSTRTNCPSSMRATDSARFQASA